MTGLRRCERARAGSFPQPGVSHLTPSHSCLHHTPSISTPGRIWDLVPTDNGESTPTCRHAQSTPEPLPRCEVPAELSVCNWLSFSLTFFVFSLLSLWSLESPNIIITFLAPTLNSLAPSYLCSCLAKPQPQSNPSLHPLCFWAQNWAAEYDRRKHTINY